ncbi:MAG: DEAD/DEAH box helicase [Lachnoclostridium sp.]|jgi:SNF2 family DNA or RNA helicase|nr:DEAD/DEAH box helicase [Lachnoclostridium sp.]
MKATFSIDPENLIISIVLEGKNDRVVNDLKLLFSGLSDDFSFEDNKFSIPWFELRRGIGSVANVLKRESVKVHFDDLTTQLVKNTIDDRKSIKKKTSSYEVTEDNIGVYLQQAGFERSLKPEQTRDALKLLRIQHGANFSVPGAGKTTTILAVHSALKQLGVVDKLFVISPINAFISWEDEIKEIFRNKPLKTCRLLSSNLSDFSTVKQYDPDVVLVNYEKFRKNVNALVPFFITNNVHLILDESHRIKSGTNNMSFNQIIKLGDMAKRRDILSGTPMPQSYLDLIPQFDYLWPGEDIIPDDLQNSESENAFINNAIRNLFVRTTKNELGLKEPHIRYTSIHMGAIQTELYNLFKSETARLISGMDKANMQNFRKIGRSVVKLLQAATNPMLLSLNDEYEEDTIPIPVNQQYWELLEDFRKYEKPVKIEYLLNRVKDITSANSQNKVLIWSYFVRNIKILEKLLQEHNPVTIYGGIPTGSDEEEVYREGRIRKFHEDPDCRVMIANPQACGEGISLHRVCHYAIYLDRNFNAAYFLQSIDRIHRLGLANNVDTNIEILISENSIDELLISRLNDKIKAMGNVLDDPYLHFLAYDPADVVVDNEAGLDVADFDAIKNHVESK